MHTNACHAITNHYTCNSILIFNPWCIIIGAIIAGIILHCSRAAYGQHTVLAQHPSKVIALSAANTAGNLRCNSHWYFTRLLIAAVCTGIGHNTWFGCRGLGGYYTFIIAVLNSYSKAVSHTFIGNVDRSCICVFFYQGKRCCGEVNDLRSSIAESKHQRAARGIHRGVRAKILKLVRHLGNTNRRQHNFRCGCRGGRCFYCRGGRWRRVRCRGRRRRFLYYRSGRGCCLRCRGGRGFCLCNRGRSCFTIGKGNSTHVKYQNKGEH